LGSAEHPRFRSLLPVLKFHNSRKMGAGPHLPADLPLDRL
jgi:hypothetical protein